MRNGSGRGETKGLKGLFRSLKASELSWQRPYRTIPMADRMRHRMNDWHKLWKPTKDNQTMTRLPLQEQAKQQAATLPPLTFEQLGKTLKHLPDKACGPDAITTQLLRTAPKQALQPLLSLLQTMEAKAELPTQLTMSLVVMLAKNEKVERPITLTSVLYRVWCRMRKPLLDEWQRSLPPSMDYDRAQTRGHCPSRRVGATGAPRNCQVPHQARSHRPAGHEHLLRHLRPAKASTSSARPPIPPTRVGVRHAGLYRTQGHFG